MDSPIDPVPGDADETISANATVELPIISNDQQELPNVGESNDEADDIEETVFHDAEENIQSEPLVAPEDEQPTASEILTEQSIQEDNAVVETETENDHVDALFDKDENIEDDVPPAVDSEHFKTMEGDTDDVPQKENVAEQNPQRPGSSLEPTSQMEVQETGVDDEENTELNNSQDDGDSKTNSPNKTEKELENASISVDRHPIANSPEAMETDNQLDSTLNDSLNKSADLEEEHKPEEVDMEDVAETSISEKEKTISEDPFDSIKQNSTNKDDNSVQTRDTTANDTLDESGVTELNATNQDDSLVGDLGESTTLNKVDMDAAADDPETTISTQPDDLDTTNHDADTSTNAVDNTINDESMLADGIDEPVADANDEPVADGEVLDDLERGKGVDEELSLLPDADREITEADKERALQAEVEAAAAESVAVEEEEEAVSNQPTECLSADATDASPEDIAANSLKADEIKELRGHLSDANCFQCKEKRPGQFTFLKNSETEFLCSLECVAAFRTISENYTLSTSLFNVNQMYEAERKCIECGLTKNCVYRFNQSDSTLQFLCSDECLTKHFADHPDSYVVKRVRLVIEEKSEATDPSKCVQCFETKPCSFSFQQDDDVFNICQENCLNLLQKEQPELFRMKQRSVRVRDLPKRAGHGSATIEDPSIAVSPAKFDTKIVARTEADAHAARLDRDASFVRHCAQCLSMLKICEKNLQWETMDFCNETCLGQYQHIIGAACTTCQGAVQMTSLGKYCVRFGYEIRQFCRSACLDQFKKGLKVCSFCQKDISKDENGFLASIGGQFKDFCRASCMKKYDEMCNPKKKNVTGICAVCMNVDQVRVEVTVNDQNHSFCSNPCFSAFQFVNNINADKCQMCQKFFERQSLNAFTIYQNTNNTTLMYCSKICMNIYIITQRKIVPCQWCKVKKYNFDMIQKFMGGMNTIMLCSLNCLTLCEVSMNAMSMKKQQCDQCMLIINPQYHLTMSDASVRNFCTYQCVMSFQSRFSRAPLTLESQKPASTPNSPVPTGLPKRIKSLHQTPSNKLPVISSTTSLATPGSMTGTGKQLKFVKQGKAPAAKLTTKATNQLQSTNKIPIISNVTSLASGITTRNRKGSLQPVVELESLPSTVLRKSNPTVQPPQPPPPPKIQIKTQIVTIPSVPKRVGNMSTMCKPATINQDTQTKSNLVTVGCQTDSSLEQRFFIPIPVPIYVPQPMHMYSLPTPIPVPFPLPIPVPIFIPTTRNSANGILKELKKIQDKMPTDPFEAELLMMAEMVAGDKKKNDSDSGTDDDREEEFAINEGAALGDDMLQMALKMAQEYEEPAVDLESSMTTNTIRPDTQQHIHYDQPVIVDMLGMGQQHQRNANNASPPAQRGRKRGTAQSRNAKTPTITPPSKRARRQEAVQQPIQPEPPREPVEKADANMCLKFTFGVNAWKQWVMTKNADLEKSSIRRKPFKSELLQLTADELNYSMCLFVKEVRKPNGSEYAPDTIYYLVLGIQQYLYENGRIDNIFTDPYYERFTDCLDSVAKKFSVLYNDSQYIVTRVEEEHLWECKQLGAHSPHVLLSTLMFFNTKHFNLTTVDEHMQLSFSHIMKHWKRNPNQVGSTKSPGARNVLLRFYPPQATLDSNSRKKKVYEQQESEDNPLRCPVKLYEFYLSKCPESVKTRNDVFYLQPERSCVPDSPVWYSTQALGKPSLCKMLHRVKMVKEINIALLTS